MAKRIIKIECSCCGDCPYYNWKKHKCNKGATEGESKDPFCSDCTLDWRTNNDIV